MKNSEIFRISGEPVFVREIKPDLFRLVMGFVVVDTGEINIVVSREHSFTTGLDIEEVQTNAIGISVEYPSSDYPMENRVKDILRELREFAGLCKCDYFSYQPFGTDMGKYYGRVDDICVMRVEPRLFRRI